MAQHFLLSAQARTLSLKAIYQMRPPRAYRWRSRSLGAAWKRR